VSSLKGLALGPTDTPDLPFDFAQGRLGLMNAAAEAALSIDP